MTSHAGRLYVVACVIVTFFFVWALVAAHPWGATTPDRRVAALAVREGRLRHEAVLVRRVVAGRWKVYRAQLAQRRSQIAQRRSQIVAASVASAVPQVRVVNLPPLTITRTS